MGRVSVFNAEKQRRREAEKMPILQPRMRGFATLVYNFPKESPTALPRKPRGRVRLACGEVQRAIAASRGKPHTRHSPAGHLRWRTQPLGHGSPPFRRDTENHGNAPDLLEVKMQRLFSSLFPWDSVSREAGFPCRLAAMQRIAEAWPRADVCLHTNPPTARRALAQPAPPTASVVGRKARSTFHPSLTTRSQTN